MLNKPTIDKGKREGKEEGSKERDATKRNILIKNIGPPFPLKKKTTLDESRNKSI